MTEGLSISDIVETLKQTEDSKALSDRVKAQLIIKGIQKLLPNYEPGREPEHTAMQYLREQAEIYLKKQETKEIMAKGLQNLVYVA